MKMSLLKLKTFLQLLFRVFFFALVRNDWEQGTDVINPHWWRRKVSHFRFVTTKDRSRSDILVYAWKIFNEARRIPVSLFLTELKLDSLYFGFSRFNNLFSFSSKFVSVLFSGISGMSGVSGMTSLPFGRTPSRDLMSSIDTGGLAGFLIFDSRTG